MTNNGWYGLRRRALLIVMGFVVLGLISGLLAYESVKERGASMKRGMQAAAADRTVVLPPIDAPRSGPIETATFALG